MIWFGLHPGLGDIRFWDRMLCMNDYILTNFLFSYEYEECKHNLSSDFKLMCASLNMDDVFQNRIVIRNILTIQSRTRMNKNY